MNENNFNQRKLSRNKSDAANSISQKQSGKALFHAIVAGLGIGFLLGLIIIIWSPTISEWGYTLYPTQKFADDSLEIKIELFEKSVIRLEKKVQVFRKEKRRLTPREPYLIINTSENLIVLKAGEKILHEGICSTGSYTLLKTADGKEQWIFKTPRGRMRIQNKIQDPVWRMPDWAFIEEGRPVPEPYADERYEPGVLGDYALDLGDGYLIHGTLYQRFLGLPVTHGCVRLGDKELKIVYQKLNVGSKVFIY